MKSAVINKALLCACPPALLATSAVTVPPVRKAVHHLTQPRHAGADTPHRRTVAAAAVPCAPVLGVEPIQPLATFAEPVPDEPGVAGLESLPGGITGIGGIGGGTTGSGGVAIGGIGGGGGGGTTTPVTGTTPTAPVTAVPEPTSWSLLLLGFGGLALLLRAGRSLVAAPAAAVPVRRRRRRRGALAVAGAAGWEAVPLSATGVAATRSALLAKAALCVCPPALMVGTVATVPAVRHAVYAATAPRSAPVAAAPVGVPCDTIAATPKPIKDIATIG